MGMNTSMPGQEGIPSVFSPMARTLADLVYFSKSMISMKPWNYDHSVHPIEWREEQELDAKHMEKFRVGVLRTDGRLLYLVFVPNTNNHQESLTQHPPVLEH